MGSVEREVREPSFFSKQIHNNRDSSFATIPLPSTCVNENVRLEPKRL